MTSRPVASDAGSGLDRSLLALALPVALSGAATAAVAAWATLQAVTWSMAAGMAALLVAALVAEAFPVPMESLPAGYVSLAAVFVVGTALVYGWAPAALVAAATRITLELVQRRPLIRLAYNGAVYALGGAAAGACIAVGPDSERVAPVLVSVFLGSVAFYIVNVVLVAAVIARWAGQRFAPLLLQSLSWTAAPFALMASVSLMLVVLWRESPAYAIALFGPLVAMVLYQRSTHSALKAMRLALTDQLTGLGNHRHFMERLQADLDRAEAAGTPLALCVIDLDNFKQINDRYGHPVGDAVLAKVASCLRQGGEAFRIGGDEFALLLPGRDQAEGVEIANTVVARLTQTDFEHGEPVTFSAGVAAYPTDGVERAELVRVADVALYLAKGEGKNRVRPYDQRLREVA